MTETATPVVILVRPQLGENIGMAARAMLNCGLSQMRLVSPRDGWPNPSARRAAAGADTVLEGAQVFGSVAEAVADLQQVVATTARSRQITQRQLTARRAARTCAAGSGRAIGGRAVRSRAHGPGERRPRSCRHHAQRAAQSAILLAQYRPGRPAGGLRMGDDGRYRSGGAARGQRHAEGHQGRARRTSMFVSNWRSTSRASCATRRCGPP